MKRTKTGRVIAVILLTGILINAFHGTEVMAANQDTVRQTSADVVRKRVRPVKMGESLTGIARDVYGDSSYAELLYEANRSMIGEEPDYLQAGTCLVLPEAAKKGMKWDSLYEKSGKGEEWDIYEAYCKDKVSYRIEEHYFYKNPEDEEYGRWESGEEVFDICYPQIVFEDGRDATLINIAVRDCAMRTADALYLNPQDSLVESCRADEKYHFSWLRSTVHYQITYMDEHLLSVVFQDAFFAGSIYAESYEMRSMIINLDTGHVYTRDEVFADKEGLAKELHDRLQAGYETDDKCYEVYENVMDEELFVKLLQTEKWVDKRYQGSMFLDADGISLAVSYRVNSDGLLWRGYEAVSFTPKEIEAYRSESELWEIWTWN